MERGCFERRVMTLRAFGCSDEEEEEQDVEVENTYYTAKALKATNIDQALAEFAKVCRTATSFSKRHKVSPLTCLILTSLQVVEIEQEKGEWGFRALKQMIKLLFVHQRYDEMFSRYRQLLDEYTATGAVTQNVSEKGIDR